MKGHKTVVTISVALLLLTAPIVAAQTITYIDDFEDGNANGWSSNSPGQSTVINNQSVINGSFSYQTNPPGSEVESNFDTVDRSAESVTWKYRPVQPTSGSQASIVLLGDDGGTTRGFAEAGVFDGYFKAFDGANGTFVNTTIAPQEDGVYFLSVDNINYTSETFTFRVFDDTGTELGNASGSFYRSLPAVIEIQQKTNGATAVYDDYTFNYSFTGGNGGQVETALELEIDSWMPRDDSQPYRVYLNETNTTTGKTNLTEVTADANVTIYNITNTTGFSEPIATVNNSTDTIKSYNQTGVVAVNATYNGNELANASNLTVGPRNLSNIGIMPPEQWPCSFLGCDEAPGGGDNPHNIGSSMQWLWLIIVVMVAATRFAENPFVGVGTGIVFSILVWVLEYIDLGAVLITVFSGLLIGGLMARTQMGRGVTRDNEEAARISRGRNE